MSILSFTLLGGAYFPAAAAYVAAAAAAASAATPTRLVQRPMRTDSGSSNSNGWTKPPERSSSSSAQQFAPHPNSRQPLSADDLFNKQLKKAADDFIPEHTIEEAEAPTTTPISLQSPPLRSTSKTVRQDSRNDREHAAINLSSVYVGESITYEDSFTNPQWTKLVDRLNKIPPKEHKKDEIPAVPVFSSPRMSGRESHENNTEENNDNKPITFNRPRK